MLALSLPSANRIFVSLKLDFHFNLLFLTAKTTPNLPRNGFNSVHLWILWKKVEFSSWTAKWRKRENTFIKNKTKHERSSFTWGITSVLLYILPWSQRLGFAYRYVVLVVLTVSLAAFTGDRGEFGGFYQKQNKTKTHNWISLQTHGLIILYSFLSVWGTNLLEPKSRRNLTGFTSRPKPIWTYPSPFLHPPSL